MMGYLDIHSHILPGVDDGSKDMEMSMQMIQRAYEEGVRYMIATPHFYPGYKNAKQEHILDVFEQLQQQVAASFPDMTLMLGNEIYYKDEAVRLLAEKEIFTLNHSRYILVEFNVRLEYRKIYQAVKRLTMDGYYPILAHVERYACLYKREDLVQELIEAGAYIQVNAQTFLGGLLDGYKRFCLKLFAQGMVHFLGSDCHDMEGRSPVMQQAIEVLKRKTDSEVLETVLEKNTERFLRNEFI